MRINNISNYSNLKNQTIQHEKVSNKDTQFFPSFGNIRLSNVLLGSLNNLIISPQNEKSISDITKFNKLIQRLGKISRYQQYLIHTDRENLIMIDSNVGNQLKIVIPLLPLTEKNISYNISKFFKRQRNKNLKKFLARVLETLEKTDFINIEQKFSPKLDSIREGIGDTCYFTKNRTPKNRLH